MLLFAAFRVITARNPVHAALFLVLAFFTAPASGSCCAAEFLAIALVLVYVGAVMVLFLFVVMMLDINVDALRVDFWRHFPLAALVGVVIALEMAAVLHRRLPARDSRPAPDALLSRLGNTKLLGIEVAQPLPYPLQIAAVLLLVAIIAAIALTLRKREDSRFLNPAQARVKKADRLRIVRMKPTIEAASPAAEKPEGVA